MAYYKIFVTGYAEYEEPFCHGTYTRRVTCSFAKEPSFLKTVRTLKTLHLHRQFMQSRIIKWFDYVDSSEGELVEFMPHLFKIINDKKQLIAIGTFTVNALVFSKKAKSEEAIQALVKKITHLEKERAYESLGDNFYTMQCIDKKIELLKLKLPNVACQY